jgi:hypothetical protein
LPIYPRVLCAVGQASFSTFCNLFAFKMPIEINRMVESDIEGAIDCIQKAFAEDPYFEWVFSEDVRQYIQSVYSQSLITRRLSILLVYI